MPKVACCGEHTTHSSHPAFLPEYPGRVGELLGADYEVENFGFATAVVTAAVGDPAKEGGGKARVYSETEEAAACAAFAVCSSAHNGVEDCRRDTAKPGGALLGGGTSDSGVSGLRAPRTRDPR